MPEKSKNPRRCIQFKTPAKINTFLYIQNKRPDHYHELLMDLIPVSLFDRLEFAETSTGKIELESNLPGISPEDNLVVKAVRLLEQETGSQFSLKIKLIKNIPTGAGLGGGSGNAGGTLSVLNSWYSLKLSNRKLRELGLQLGADIPFFVNPRPSLAQGIGEQLSELPPFAPLKLLLLYPGFPIATGNAYAHCQISGRKGPLADYSFQTFSRTLPAINDFWVTLKKAFPVLESCRNALNDEGAIFSGLSGSGSTVFAVYTDDAACQRAYSNLSSSSTWQLFRCQTLSHHSYLD